MTSDMFSAVASFSPTGLGNPQPMCIRNKHPGQVAEWCTVSLSTAKSGKGSRELRKLAGMLENQDWLARQVFP